MDISSIIFKWIALVFSFFLIIIGSMSICEGQQSNNHNYDIGLISIGSITVILATILLFFIIYILKKYPDKTSWGFCYVVVLMIVFGVAIGTIAIINGVDAPTTQVRNTLGWVIGILATSMGITGTIWTIISLLQAYSIKPFDSLPQWV